MVNVDHTSPRRYLPELDGLRAVAAWVVVAYHMGIASIPGAYGVELFFVLSGYLITTLLYRELHSSGFIDYRAFFTRRVFRIMPAFYVYLTCAVAWSILRRHEVNWLHLASAATYTVNYFNALWGDPNTGFSHAWSLAVEEQYYLIWPFIFFMLARRKDDLRVIGYCIGFFIVLRLALKFCTSLPQSYFYSAFEMRASSLLFGALAAGIAVRHPTALRTTLDRWGAKRVQIVSVMVVATLALIEARHGTVFRDSVTAVVLPGTCAMLILSTVRVAETGIQQWLCHPQIRWLGRLSYSTYLYQQLLAGAMGRAAPQWPVLVQRLSEALGILLLASLSYYLIEQPALRLKARFSRGPGHSNLHEIGTSTAN
jgi:peptidoglycan/LPS O-acetylase OafA/YrhL